MNSNLSITGINKPNLLTLTGNQNSDNTESIYITRIKKRIFDLFIIPLQKNRWDIINQNLFAYDNIYLKLKKYYKINPSNDIYMYITIIETILELAGEYTVFNNTYKENQDGIAKLEQMMPSVRLAPAYELYNLILGKPNNNIYDDFKIAEINRLLMSDNITFEEIKNNIF
jgi:hypothetical protein